jgi:Protein of unknown function (DUF3040)
MGGTVPLSEHEQRQLEQIEQALYADHPRLARIMRAKDPRVHYRRRVIQATIGFLIGVGLLVAGLLTKHTYLDLAGFVIMLVSSMWAITSYRRMTGVLAEQSKGRKPVKSAPGHGHGHGRSGSGGGGSGSGGNSGSGGMMERMEERWRRRQERDR